MAMELDHSFTVPVPPDQAWDVLLDVQNIAPCMPGATVETVDGDDVAGKLKVKVGPVSLTYKGTATFKDRDAADRSLLVHASGKEMRGAGTASATVRAALRPGDGADSGDGQTLVALHTTLSVTGRPAQFGRGVIADVGSRLIDKFADNLAQQLTNGGFATAPPASTATSPAATVPSGGLPPAPAEVGTADATGSAAGTAVTTEAPVAQAATHVPVQVAPGPVQPVPVQHQDESLDLVSLVGPVIAKRLAPVAGAIAGAALLTWAVRRVIRRRTSS